MSSQLVLVLNLQDTKLFPEPEDNASNPSIQRSSCSPSSLLSPLSRLQESYLKDWLCSFSPGGGATAQNRSELLV